MAVECKECCFYETCKKRDNNTNTCYPFILMYGAKGTTGIWKAVGVPKRYKKCRLDNLPIKAENPKVYKMMEKYIGNILANVLDKNISLYLYSIPIPANKLGVGNGKTTTAVTILNHFTIEICRAYLKGQYRDLFNQTNPSLFVKCSEFQNVYNAQFRGNEMQKEDASIRYYSLKNSMKKVPLLVLDDIAIRNSTEAFLNELYEVIDARVNEELTTIYTSNVTLEEVSSILDDRVSSRISSNCVLVGMTGTDHRGL